MARKVATFLLMALALFIIALAWVEFGKITNDNYEFENHSEITTNNEH